MASAWAAIVARIVAKMNEVPNIGLVHDSTRLAMSEQDFLGWARVDIGGDARIRTWMVTMEDVPEVSWATLDGMVDWTRRASIKGLFQVEDAQGSESTAMALAEAVCAKLDTDLAATRLAGTVSFGGPCRIIHNEPRLFSFVLAHYIEIELALKTTDQR